MFDRLDDMLRHYEELMLELNNPSVAEDQRKFRKLMKEQADLAPIVDAYKQYKQAKQDVEDSLALLDEESDEEMKELAKEELADAKKRIEELEQELKILAVQLLHGASGTDRRGWIHPDADHFKDRLSLLGEVYCSGSSGILYLRDPCNIYTTGNRG